MQITQPLSTIVFTAATGVFALILGRKTRLPAILYFLIFGILLGPQFADLVQPAIFRRNFPHYISVMVALILFEGAASLRFNQLKNISGVVRNLLTVGVFVSGVVTALAVKYFTDLSWSVAIIFGSIMIVTGPTVVIPILRRIRIRENVHNILKWEAIIVDPWGVILSVVIFEVLITAHLGAVAGMVSLVVRIVAGIVIGLIAGFIMHQGLTRKWLLRFESEDLGGLYLLAIAILSYGFSEWLFHESGLVTATVAGLYIGSKDFPLKDRIFHFRDQVTLFALAALFILLASNVPVRAILGVLHEGTWILAAMILVARPLSVFLSTLREKSMGIKEKLFLSFCAPRGIVSASMASLFAIQFEEQALSGKPTFLPLAFYVISGTILFYGLLTPLFARIFGVVEKALNGVIFIGAHPLTVIMARLLRDRGIQVEIIDNNTHHLAEARKEGIRTYFGNAFSKDFVETLDLKGIGKMIAMTPNHEVNILANQVFAMVLGRQSVFRLAGQDETPEKAQAKEFDDATGMPLFPIGYIESSWTNHFEPRFKTLDKPLTVNEKELEAAAVSHPLFAIKDKKPQFFVPGTTIPKGSEIVYLQEIGA